MGVALLLQDDPALFRWARERVRQDVGTLIDIGAGIRPQSLVRCAKHICVEPHGAYAEALEQHGYPVIHADAVTALEAYREPVDTIVALDVIEHMERDEGYKFLALATERAKQVVIFTPLGFLPQEGDAWGMGGEHWQRHRSGWTSGDFYGWTTCVEKRFHEDRGGKGGAFFAIWTAE